MTKADKFGHYYVFSFKNLKIAITIIAICNFYGTGTIVSTVANDSFQGKTKVRIKIKV